jgi:hypothetical protein
MTRTVWDNCCYNILLIGPPSVKYLNLASWVIIDVSSARQKCPLSSDRFSTEFGRVRRRQIVSVKHSQVPYPSLV